MDIVKKIAFFFATSCLIGQLQGSENHHVSSTLSSNEAQNSHETGRFLGIRKTPLSSIAIKSKAAIPATEQFPPYRQSSHKPLSHEHQHLSYPPSYEHQRYSYPPLESHLPHHYEYFQQPSSSNNYCNCPPGPPGQPGPPGAQGFEGPKGSQGKKGSLGSVGTPGKPGARGAKGEQGRNGKHGSKGDIGFPGAPGNIGHRGPTGLVGPPGATGRIETMWHSSNSTKRLDSSVPPVAVLPIAAPTQSHAQILKQPAVHTNKNVDINNTDSIDPDSDNDEVELNDNENWFTVEKDYEAEADEHDDGSAEALKEHSSKEILDNFFERFGNNAEERSALKLDSKSETKKLNLKTTNTRRRKLSPAKVIQGITGKVPSKMFLMRYYL